MRSYQSLLFKYLRGIGNSIRSAPYYKLMADEVTDSSNREQVVMFEMDRRQSRTTQGLHWAL